MTAGSMRRLGGARERLDGPLDDPATLRGNLRDLRRVNRWLGGARLSRDAIGALLRVAGPGDERGRPLRVLDVGTGAGDIPVALLTAWRHGAIDAHVTAVDSRPEVIRAAMALDPGLAATPGLELAVADGRALPYPDGAFDVAHASMVLHHVEPAETGAFVRELARVARVGIVINDLDRGRLAWCWAWILAHLLTRNPLTRHDGPLSVRRAYTRPEARAIVEAAGLRVVHEAEAPFGHRWAIAAVRA